MRELMPELREWWNANEKIALATVVETWGSSPRPVGSKMAVTESGKMAGSVSNGCIEGAVFEEAQKVLQAGKARMVEFGVADQDAFEVGLACGGQVKVFIQPFGDVQEAALRYLEEERPAVLRTDTESGFSRLWIEEARDERMGWEDGRVFVEPLLRPPHLIIVGAIHIAIPLHRMAKLMGYRVTVVDARSKFADAERFPEADQILQLWPDEALAGISLDRSTYVVILTHDPKFDLPALRAVLPADVRYIGAIGSRKTNQNRFQKLREEGFSDEQLSRVHGPIGLDLGGRGAEETALAIMAELTAVRHGGHAGFMSSAQSEPVDGSAPAPALTDAVEAGEPDTDSLHAPSKLVK
jgi:xanthine dehydrogenase accessory factor